MYLDNKLCRTLMAETIKLANKTVGEVTVLHQVAAMQYINVKEAAAVNDINTLVRATKVWGALFDGKLNNSTAKEYVKQCTTETSDTTGLLIAHVNKAKMEETMHAVSEEGLKFTFSSVSGMLEACEDFVAYGRYVQEKTIDAAKNFFNVTILWLKEFGNVSLCYRHRANDEFNCVINWTRSDSERAEHKAKLQQAKSKEPVVIEVVKHESDCLENGMNAVSTVSLAYPGKEGKVPVGNGKEQKYVMNDILNQLSVEGLKQTAAVAEEVSRYNPLEAEKLVDELSARRQSDLWFRTLCDMSIYYAHGLYRTLTTAMHTECNAIRVALQYKPEEANAQVKLIRAKYAELYRALGNQVKVAAVSISNKMGKTAELRLSTILEAMIWASYHGEKDEKIGDYVRYASCEASSFAHQVLPDEFAKYMLQLARSAGYSVPEYTEDALRTKTSDLKNAPEQFEADFIFGIANTKYGKVIAKNKTLKGRFLIRTIVNKENGKSHLVASRKIDDLITCEQADHSKLIFISSMDSKWANAREAFISMLARGKEVTIADSAYHKSGRVKNAIICDDKIVSAVRSITISAKTEDNTGFNAIRDAIKSVHGCKKGTLESMRVYQPEGCKCPCMVFVLKDVKPCTINYKKHYDMLGQPVKAETDVVHADSTANNHGARNVINMLHS